MLRKTLPFLIFFITAFTAVALAQAPVANFGISTVTATPDSFCAGIGVHFVDSSTNSPTAWSWNFNSTANVNVTATPPTAASQNPTVFFSNSTSSVQMVVVTLSSSNSFGSSLLTATKNIYIKPGVPVAQITSTPSSICKDSSITFSSSSSIGLITSWFWNFGNGKPSSSSSSGSIRDTFSNIAGTTVTLTVGNSCGTNQANKIITVNTPPTAAFLTGLTGSPCKNTAIHYTDGSSGNVTAWHWDFGDGHTSNLQNPVDSFPTAGTYTVTLTAYNSCGASQPFTQTITVINCSPPIAHFTTLSDTVCMNMPIQFTDSSSNGPYVVTWLFTNTSSTYANINNPIIYFNSAGIATIAKITVTNAYGSSTYQKNIVVLRCLPPVALFDSWGSICEGTCTYMTNNSLEGPFDSIRWFFTGATPAISKAFNPSNICYNKAGTYQIKLIAYNTYGSDTLIKPIVVLPSPHILSRDTCIYAGFSTMLMAHGNGTITWSPTLSLSSPTGDTVLATPLNQTTYIVRDTSNCPSPDSVTICLKYKNVYITAPNTFTPDGNSKNDFFKIVSKDNLPINEYSIKIFNRWGEMVFKSSDYLEGWDGTQEYMFILLVIAI